MNRDSLKGFAGSITVFCGQISACMAYVLLMAKRDKKNAAREK